MDPGVLAWRQISYTAPGFLLLDPAVAGVDPKNARYGPAEEALVDALTRVLFFLALPAALFLRRRNLFQPVAAFAIMLVLTQILTVNPPHYARGVFALPFIYLMVAVLPDTVWRAGSPGSRVFQRGERGDRSVRGEVVCQSSGFLVGQQADAVLRIRNLALSAPSASLRLRPRQMAMVAIVLVLSAWNVQHYFEWGSSAELAQAREPAIEYSRAPLWIATEKEHIASGAYDLAITTEEW